MFTLATHPSPGCPFCGTSQIEESLPAGNGYQMLLCAHCGLWYADTVPSEEEIHAFYQRGEFVSSMPQGEFLDYLVKESYPRILSLIERYSSRGRLLDVGCGPGALLAVAESRGWEAHGIEPAAEAVAHARQHFGLQRVRRGLFETGQWPDGYFHALSFIHVLEHLRNPLLALQKANRILKTGGILFIACPVVDKAVFRMLCRLPSRRLRNKFVFKIAGGAPPFHLVTFSRRTLNQYLERSGFRPVDWVYERGRYPLAINAKGWLFDKALYPVPLALKSGQTLLAVAQKT